MSGGRHEAANRRRTVAVLALMALWVATLFGATWAAADPPADVPGAPSADGVQPEITPTKASSDRCGQLGFDHGLSFSGNGSASSDAMTVTISGFNSPAGTVAWSSNLPIHGVVVKGGPSGNLFAYPTGDTADQDLHTPQKGNGGFYSVGVVAVCWNDVASPTNPDVTVTKAAQPDGGAVEPAGTITYTLSVSNAGNANAAAVVVTDELPAGVTLGNATPGCNEASGTVTCGPADLEAGLSLDYEITVTVNEGFCGDIVNTAHVSAANEVGSATGNNDSNTVTNTVACLRVLQEELPPDLQVTKSSDANGPLHPGDVVHYTITVTNVGDVTATGVRLVDVLPVGANGVGTPFTSFGGQFCIVTSSLPPGGVPHAEVRCGPIPIAPGATASVTISAYVTDDACGEITNEVDVTGSNEPDEHAGADNHAEVTDGIECPPRIRLVKTGPARAHVGDTVTYRFTVTNRGGVALNDIEVTDPGCDGSVTLVDDGNGNAVLGAGETWRFRCGHTIVAGDGDPVHNVAKVTGDPGEGRVSDTDGHDVDVLHPDIELEKTASPTSGTPGTTVVYTFVVTNTGDATLFDISVDDDTVGHVGGVASLAPGASATRTVEIALGSSPVSGMGTAAGADALDLAVSDTDAATVEVVAGTGGSGGSGSPFTGSETGPLAAWAIALSAVGLALVKLTRRRSPARS